MSWRCFGVGSIDPSKENETKWMSHADVQPSTLQSWARASGTGWAGRGGAGLGVGGSWFKLAILPRNIYALLTEREVKMAGYWPSFFFFCVFMDRDEV